MSENAHTARAFGLSRARVAWFVAFTSLFSVLAAFVFWGTWSFDASPVMPDCAWQYPQAYSTWIADWWRGWLASGLFVPDDIKVFIGSPDGWNELRYAFAAYCAALGVAYYCRGRGLSLPASFGAGLLLAFSGYWFSLFSAGHLGWFRWMTYGIFAFGLADRATRKGKWKNWILLGACVAWGLFYQPDLWLLFTVFTGAYLLWRTFLSVRETNPDARVAYWKHWGCGALMALVVFLLISAPGIRAAIGAKNDRERVIENGDTVPADKKESEDSRWIFVTNWSLPPAESAEFFIPRLNGDTSCVLTQALGRRLGTGVTAYEGALGRPINAASGNYRQHALYVGWMTCLLSLLGFASAFLSVGRRHRQEIFFFACAAVLFWMLSLGRHCEPLYRCVFALPIGDAIRCPVKWHHLTELCLVVLAAYGADGVLTSFRGRWSIGLGRVRADVATLLVVLALAFGAWDVARIDRLYCAPIDLSRARATNSIMEMTLLGRESFSNPQVKAMVNAGRIVSLAGYPGNPDVFLVGILNPRPRETHPFPPFGTAAKLGVVSAFASLTVLLLALVGSLRGNPFRCLRAR